MNKIQKPNDADTHSNINIDASKSNIHNPNNNSVDLGYKDNFKFPPFSSNINKVDFTVNYNNISVGASGVSNKSNSNDIHKDQYNNIIVNKKENKEEKEDKTVKTDKTVKADTMERIEFNIEKPEKMEKLGKTLKQDKDSINEHNSLFSTTKKITCKIENKNFISENDCELEQKYKIVKFLGKGAFGTVHKVLHKSSGMFRAMKTIKQSYVKKQDDDQRFLKEIEILQESNHPNIIKIIEYFKDSINYYLILEYLPKGDLSQTIEYSDKFTEPMAATILKQLFSAIYYMHSKNIVHRDIKPENILINEFSEENPNEISIKLSDFGTCNYVSEGENLRRRVGSPYYIAPEILNKNYNEKCDIWSCGVLMYFLLVGEMPFQGKTIDDIKKKILIGKYDTKSYLFTETSKEAQHLIKKLLHFDYKSRISAEEALQHPWFKKYYESFPINEERVQKVGQNLKNFKLNDKLQLAALAFLVHFIDTNDEVSQLVEIFKSMDQNGDGRLNFSELVEGMSKIKGKIMSEDEIMHVFEMIDQDKNGYIEYEEFVRVCIDRTSLLSKKNLHLAFDNFDRDNDGFLNSDDIKMILGTEDNQYVQNIIDKIDHNKDGKINFSEFSMLMRTILNSSTKKFAARKSNTIYENVSYDMSFALDSSKKKNVKNYKSCSSNQCHTELKNSLFMKEDEDYSDGSL